MTPDELIKDWFQRHHLTLEGYSHAFRDGSMVGNSEEIIDVTIINKE